MTFSVKIIAAVNRNGIIGSKGGIPWHIPEELQHFRDTTMGCSVIMGRGTFESIGEPLMGRTTIVMSRDTGWAYPDASVFSARSMDHAIQLAQELVPNKTCWIAGGADIYRAGISYASEMLISDIPNDYRGDTYFPPYITSQWPVTSVTPHANFSVIQHVKVPSASGVRGPFGGIYSI